MKKYQQLENKIKELQAEVERLKKEEKLPRLFDRELVMNFIQNPNEYCLKEAFVWDDTPQGVAFWEKVNESESVISDEALIQLQEWVIQSYHEDFGD